MQNNKGHYALYKERRKNVVKEYPIKNVTFVFLEKWMTENMNTGIKCMIFKVLIWIIIIYLGCQ